MPLIGNYRAIECPAKLLAELERERHSIASRDVAKPITQAQRITDTDSERLIAHGETIKDNPTLYLESGAVQ